MLTQFSNVVTVRTALLVIPKPPCPDCEADAPFSGLVVKLEPRLGGFWLHLTPHSAGWYVKYRAESVEMQYRAVSTPATAAIFALIYQPHKAQNITLQKTVLGLAFNADYEVRFILKTADGDALCRSAWKPVRTLPKGAPFA